MSTSQPASAAPLDLIRWISLAQLRAGEAWNRERDLSRAQGMVLSFLTERPGASQGDIARMSGTSAASVSSLLKGLERRSLIERRTEGGDERTKRVYVTDTGAALITGFITAMDAANERLLAPLSPAEREQLRSLLAKITAELPQPTRE